MTVYRRFGLSLLCAASVIVVTRTAGADDALQPLADVRAAAAAHVQAQLGKPVAGLETHVAVADLDPRLRLALCPQAPSAFLPQGARIAPRMTVGVRCDARGWTVYTSVAMETDMPVLVATRAAARDAALTAADVEVQRRRVPGFAAGYLTRVDELTGRHLRQPVAPGTVLTVDLVANDVLVKRGQRVLLVAGAGGIEVRAPGEAIADATPAGRVRVQNLNSRRVVEGRVETADRVRIEP